MSERKEEGLDQTTFGFSKEVWTFKLPYSGHLLQLLDQAQAAAIANGGDNRPLTSDIAIDSDQKEVQHAASQLAHFAHSHYQRRIQVQESELEKSTSDFRNPLHTKNLENLVEKSKHDIDQAFKRAQPELVGLKRHELETQAHLNQFRAANRINRPAIYPASSTAHLTLLAAIGLFEALLNVFFYGQGQSLVDALMTALFVSAVNVLFCFGFGIGVRNLNNNIGSKQKAVGWMAAIGWVIFAFHLNKYLSLFRSFLVIAKDSDPVAFANHQTSAVMFNLSPFSGFAGLDLSSWLLFGVGTLISIFALRKGYTSDDPYPQFGSIDRRYRAAREAYLIEEHKLRGEVEAIGTAAEAVISALELSRQTALTKFTEMANLLEKTVKDYERDSQSIESDFRHLIEVYRNANLQVRTTAPPLYFKVPLTIARRTIAVDVRWLGDSIDGIRVEMNQNTKDIINECRLARNALFAGNAENGQLIELRFESVTNQAQAEIGHAKRAS